MDPKKKQQIVDELQQIFLGSGMVIISHYDGLTVSEMQDLRSRVQAAGGGMRITKNNLARIALLGESASKAATYLSGMTTLAFSEDPVAASKVMDAYAQENKKLRILGGILDGAVLDTLDVQSIARLPSRRELIASIAEMIGSPAAAIAQIISQRTGVSGRREKSIDYNRVSREASLDEFFDSLESTLPFLVDVKIDFSRKDTAELEDWM